jgi:hypothetical protein
MTDTVNPTFKSVVDKKWRVPAHLVPQIGANTVEQLPMKKEHFDYVDKSAYYAVRCNDAYFSPHALEAGERGFVRVAMSHAHNIILAEADDGKDPLLLLGHFQLDEIKDRISNRVNIVKNPKQLPDELRKLCAGLGATVEGYPFAVQKLAGKVDNYWSDSVQVSQFKNYAIKMAKETPPADSEVCCMPRKYIVMDPSKVFTFQTTLSAEVVTAAKALKSVSKFQFCKNKGAVRVVPNDESVLNSLESKKAWIMSVFEAIPNTFRGAMIDIDQIWIPASSSKNDNPLIVVKRRDGNPMSEEAARGVAHAFGMKKARITNGVVLGRVTEEMAAQLDGCSTEHLNFSIAKPAGAAVPANTDAAAVAAATGT